MNPQQEILDDFNFSNNKGFSIPCFLDDSTSSFDAYIEKKNSVKKYCRQIVGTGVVDFSASYKAEDFIVYPNRAEKDLYKEICLPTFQNSFCLTVEKNEFEITNTPLREEINQRWEGVVVNVEGDGFLARLVSLSDEEEEQEVKISFSLVHKEKDQIAPGVFFYLYFGNELFEGDSRIKPFTRFLIKTIPRIDPKEIEQQAEEILKLLKRR